MFSRLRLASLAANPALTAGVIRTWRRRGGHHGVVYGAHQFMASSLLKVPAVVAVVAVVLLVFSQSTRFPDYYATSVWPAVTEERPSDAAGRGSQSFTFRLNVSGFCGIAGARKGYVARAKGVLGGV